MWSYLHAPREHCLVTRHFGRTTHLTAHRISPIACALILLQRLSSDVAYNGEWECLHKINIESQRTLAEMNETLGSLRQWREQRDIDPRTTDPEGAPKSSAELSLLPELNPNPHWNRSSPETMRNWPRRDTDGSLAASQSAHDVADADSCGEEVRNQLSAEAVVGDAQDPLVSQWQVTL